MQLKKLYLWHFPTGVSLVYPAMEVFVLKTCQRSVYLSFHPTPFGDASLPRHEKMEGLEAYQFLLETICGLKSKLLGENEIVGQFKTSYQQFWQIPRRDTQLLLVLEKLFKDAKDIRTEHLIGLGQKTYASLTRKAFLTQQKAKHILILGSGQLTEDLINQFKKKAVLTLCARPSERFWQLAKHHQINTLQWDQKHLWADYAFIANTIGFEGTLLDETFFSLWHEKHLEEKLFVDLGSPSCLKTLRGKAEGLIRLTDLFEEGALLEEQKRVKVELAQLALEERVQHRAQWLEKKFNERQVENFQSLSVV